MPLTIIRDDITKVKADAIVNAANPSLLGGGGVDGAIHAAAGPKLLEACRKLHGCEPGNAKITKGYNLPAKYVIHTVGPIWRGGNHLEHHTLANCYQNCLELAKKHHCDSIAFPLISAGAYGFPKEQALDVAVHVISHFLAVNDMQVILVVYDRNSFVVSQGLIKDIISYLDDCYVDAHILEESTVLYTQALAPQEDCECRSASSSFSYPTAPKSQSRPSSKSTLKANDLDELLNQIDESFSEMLLRKIDEKGIKDSECYKKANIDRKLFSKIRSDKNYRPSKTTAIAFAIALEFDLKESKEMLQKAGYALSHSNKFDIIIEYFIQHRIYDIYQINEALFAFDQSLLGV